MRIFLITILYVLYSFSAYADTSRDSVTIYVSDSLIMVPRKVRNIAWVVPSHATTVNGWSIGWLMADGTLMSRTQHINGLYTNISPLSVVWGIMAFGYVPMMIYDSITDNDEQFSNNISFSNDSVYTLPNSNKRINGLSFSIVESMVSYTVNGFQASLILNTTNTINGVTVNVGGSISNRINGLSINGLMSTVHTLNGVSISGIYNNSNTVRGMQIGAINHSNYVQGIQIGLWNRTNKLKGLQLGLWNKSKKRSLPVLNFGW